MRPEPLLSRATFDRADEIRHDTARLTRGWPTAKLLAITPTLSYPVEDDGQRLRWLATDGASPYPDACFLGIVDGTDRWAIRRDHIDGPTASPRSGAQLLSADEAGLLATAIGILNWHATAGFSPVDGAPTTLATAGWTRTSAAGHTEFPRTDCATITLVHDGADHVLLGRQAQWPPGRFSTFAGFVEPGESLEQCVIRELHEEAGIDVHTPEYLGSQPWPFPRSLMVGFAAQADRNQPLEFIDGEITEAHWFSVDDVAHALRSEHYWAGGTDDPDDSVSLRLPASISIAHMMIENWVAARQSRDLS